MVAKVEVVCRFASFDPYLHAYLPWYFSLYGTRARSTYFT